MVESFDNCVPQPFLVVLIWRTALLRGRLSLEVRLYSVLVTVKMDVQADITWIYYASIRISIFIVTLYTQ